MKLKIAIFSIFCGFLANTSFVARANILEGNHPDVEKGRQAFNNGQYEDALKAYQKAEKELPQSPEIKFNIGNAYMNLGRPEDAKKAYESALSGASQKLKAKDYYNLGNSFAELQQDENAISAFRQALKADPQLEPARRNLEIMLRKQKNQPPSKQNDPQNSSQNQSESESESESEKQSSDSSPESSNENEKPEDPSPESNPPQSSADNSADTEESEKPSSSSSSEPPSEPIDKREAQRLLDAIRRNEKQFFMPQQNRKVTPRVPPEKDW